MQHENSGSSSIGKSSLFGLDENISAVMVGAVTLAVSFVPYASYFAWVVPVAAAIIERRSKLARLSDIQIFVSSAFISLFSWLTLVMTPYAEAAMESAAGNQLLTLGTLGVAMSLVKVVCLVCMILTTYNAYKMTVFHVPGITLLIKKLIKYSEP